MWRTGDQIAEQVNTKTRRLQKENPSFDIRRVTIFMGNHVLIALRRDRHWCNSLREIREPGKDKKMEFMNLTIEPLQDPEALIIAYEG